jgi:hypothetical protein
MPGSRVRVPPFPPTLFKDLHITLPTLERFSREFRVSLLSGSPPQREDLPCVRGPALFLRAFFCALEGAARRGSGYFNVIDTDTAVEHRMVEPRRISHDRQFSNPMFAP